MMQGWLRPKAAARYCNVGERTLRTWLKDYGLRASRVRGIVLIKREWLDTFLEGHEVNYYNKLDGIVEDVIREFHN